MTKDNASYFIVMRVDSEDEDPIFFPVKFTTEDYKEVLVLASCIAEGDPRKRVMYADITDIDEAYFEDEI